MASGRAKPITPREATHYLHLISAHLGLVELKDLLWQELNRETKHRAETIIQQAIDVQSLVWEDDDEPLPDFEDEEEVEDEADLEYDWDDLEEE